MAKVKGTKVSRKETKDRNDMNGIIMDIIDQTLKESKKDNKTKSKAKTKKDKSKDNKIDILKVNKFLKALQGKTLKQIWNDKDITDQKKTARNILQQVVRQWYKKDHIKQFPIYLSLKPKRKYSSKVFTNKVSIVLFPIRILNYPAKTNQDIYILLLEQLLDVMSDAYIKVVENIKGKETAKKIEKEIPKRLKALFK